MDVKPLYSPVGDLFKYQPVYRVPDYQRSYSWERLEIEDFIRDLDRCLNKRIYDKAVVHFFGQIVCIKDKLQGTYDLDYFELVDGQQRVATFTMLVMALRKIYGTIIEEIREKAEYNGQKLILIDRIEELTKRYLYFKKEVSGDFQEIFVLELSKRDKSFFREFIKNQDVAVGRESHKLIKEAYLYILEKVKEMTFSSSLRDRISNLQMIQQILENDFCLLNMVTGDRSAAYGLFQVLNNRGKNLTEGDLLRAESLRLLETFTAEQTRAEEAWDSILSDTPEQTEKFLRAIYSSYTGDKASSNSFFNEFLTLFLPENTYQKIDAATASAIDLKLKNLEKDILTLRAINAGTWPYGQQKPIEYWDRNRLYLLIHAFNHEECLPFLLAAKLLDHEKFDSIINIVERFVFRYLIVCNQYIGDLIAIYAEEAKKIRENTGAYTKQNLIDRLKPLEARCTDEKFNRLLDDLTYQKSGGKSNKPMKYFLLTLEYYFRWFKSGANNEPECFDKERVYDFADSTIEHIYPHNAHGTVLNPNLEPLKNTIGNLTILGNRDNRTGENDDYQTKKPIFEASSLKMNQEDVAVKVAWDSATVKARTLELKSMALAIFKI